MSPTVLLVAAVLNLFGAGEHSAYPHVVAGSRLLILDPLTMHVHRREILPRRASTALPCADWSSAMLSVWLFDEGTTGNATSDEGSCGSDCDLIEHGTGGIASTATAQQNSLARDLDGASDGDYFECDADGTPSSECDELSHTGDQSFGAWVYMNSDPTARQDLLFGAHLGTGGQRITSTSSGVVQCQTRLSSGDEYPTGSTAMTQSQWHYLSCTHDDAGDRQEVYLDGSSEDTRTGSGSLDAMDERWWVNYEFSDSDFIVDEMFVDDHAYTDAQHCRMAACGRDGSLCAYSGSTVTDDGRKTTMSLSCTFAIADCTDSSP